MSDAADSSTSAYSGRECLGINARLHIGSLRYERYSGSQMRTDAGEKKCFQNLREDWRTYDRNWVRQGLWVMVVYRFGNWRYAIRSRTIRLPFSIIYKLLKLLSEVLTGIDLPCEAKLGRRFRIDHFGGIVISGDAVFGDDCVIRNGGHCRAPTYGSARRADHRQPRGHRSRSQGARRYPHRRRRSYRRKRCCDHRCAIKLYCGSVSQRRFGLAKRRCRKRSLASTERQSR